MNHNKLRDLIEDTFDIDEMHIVLNVVKEEHAKRCCMSILINIISIFLHIFAIVLRTNTLECTLNINANSITAIATIGTCIGLIFYICSVPYYNLINRAKEHYDYLKQYKEFEND